MEKISNTKVEPAEGLVELSDLIDDYQKLVFSICFKISGDYFAAEDLAQDTFLTVYQKLDTFDGVNIKAWICRIATNKSIDYVRSAGRRLVPTEDEFFDRRDTDCGSPEEICIEKEVRQQLSSCCEKLKPPYDAIAREYYLEEQDVKEIAGRRNQNIKTIQTQIYRARDMLRKLYGRENGLAGY